MEDMLRQSLSQSVKRSTKFAQSMKKALNKGVEESSHEINSSENAITANTGQRDSIVEQQALFLENAKVAMKESVVGEGVRNVIKERGPKSCGEKFTPFILLIGLGAHSIFEGLAVGIE